MSPPAFHTADTRGPVIVMVAPNGARKTKSDHPNLPTTVEETAAVAVDCFRCGASVLHAHVRDADETHSIDSKLYRHLIRTLETDIPKLCIQITTEAVGVFTPEQQAKTVFDTSPAMASVGLREMAGVRSDLDFAKHFYLNCDASGVHIQHILYDEQDVSRFCELQDAGVIPASHRCLLFVLGRYQVNQQSEPSDLQPFLNALSLNRDSDQCDWFCCAFGAQEKACLLEAVHMGGHVRIGFENNHYRPDGTVAESNASQVADLVQCLSDHGYGIADTADCNRILFSPV
ncbi:MAG: 3-keto-5-aminohexanoate cleavage protein [Pseudomonadota bacterium]